VQLIHCVEEGGGLMPPYESRFRAVDQMQVLANIRSYYANAGIEKIPGVNQPEDHLGSLLRFMSLLCFMEGGAHKIDDPSSHSLTLGDNQRMQHTFLSNHILSWVPEYSQALQSQAKTVYLRLIGDWLERLVVYEASIFRHAI
jgi:TorA maturation chaperone TorD